MTEEGRVRVMLVARFPVIRSGLRALIGQHTGFQVVGEAGTTTEAVELAGRERPDVVLLDPDSEDVSLHAVSAVNEACDCRILVFTAETDHRVYARAIELGGAGVVSKDQPAEVLLRAILKIHEGELWLDRARTASVLSHAIRRARDPEVLKIESLTRREREIVALVGEGLRNAAIAERLFISEATVRNHLTSILSKLALADRFDLAVYAFRHGLAPSTDAAAARRLRFGPDERPLREQAADRNWVRIRRGKAE